MSVTGSESTNALVREWRDFAIEAHGNQLYGQRPYSEHLDEGAALTEHLGYPALMAAGFYLHDLDEDTKTKIPVIQAELDPPLFVISGLHAISSWKGEPWDPKLARARSDPLSHVWKFIDSSINLGAKISNPDLPKSKRLYSIRKYAYFVGVLQPGLPTPHGIREHIAIQKRIERASK